MINDVPLSSVIRSGHKRGRAEKQLYNGILHSILHRDSQPTVLNVNLFDLWLTSKLVQFLPHMCSWSSNSRVTWLSGIRWGETNERVPFRSFKSPPPSPIERADDLANLKSTSCGVASSWKPEPNMFLYFYGGTFQPSLSQIWVSSKLLIYL